MVSLSNLNDKQNMLLTQLSYESHVLDNPDYQGKSLEQILSDIESKGVTKYNEGTVKTLKKLKKAGLGSIKIKDVGNDYITGFGAVAFTDDCGNTGFSFRGTDGISLKSLNDWRDNIQAAITGTSTQSVQAETFYDRNCDADGNNYLYGHSKGGQLSESVYVNNYDEIKGVHLLNPQPLNPYSLSPDQLAAMQSKKVDIVIVEWDYVWFLGQLPSYGNVRIAKYKDGNSHLYSDDYFDDDGNIIPGEFPVIEVAGYILISNLLRGLQQLGATGGFLYNCIVRVVDCVKDELFEEAEEFIAWVSDKVAEIGNAFKQLAIDLKDFLSKTVKKAKEWYNSNFNKGYKYASANPKIVIDTRVCRNYAISLNKINKRVETLDGRIDNLYWSVGFQDLWNLRKADALLHFNINILKCCHYLDETAKDFEDADGAINNKL